MLRGRERGALTGLAGSLGCRAPTRIDGLCLSFGRGRTQDHDVGGMGQSVCGTKDRPTFTYAALNLSL